MALPYEGDTEFGRNGAYELTQSSEEVRPINVRQRSSGSEDGDGYDSDEGERKGCCTRTKESCNKFFMTVCPSCLTSLPSCVLIFVAVLIVLFVIVSIPLVFALTYSQPASLVGDGSKLPGREYADQWPIDDSEVRNENSTEFLQLSSLWPKNITSCFGFGYICSSQPGVTVSTTARCNGIADCPDGSDESNCQKCETSFSCPLKQNSSILACIRPHHICDGIPHCANGEDEAMCGRKCTQNEFSCGNKCLPKSLLCDGDLHCPNGEDEENCENKCSNGSKWCKSLKKCLPKDLLCDGRVNCEDGSDENDCDCKTCTGQGKRLCKYGDTGKGFCILDHQVCDGKNDCPDGSDEEECFGHIDYELPVNDTVTCNDGKTYSKAYACTGLVPACSGACKECDKDLSFDCGNGHCILRSKVCNGVNDCPNGLDEKNCSTKICPSTSIQCTSKLPNGNIKCIEKSQQCNGYHDCPGGEDEKDCSKCANPANFYCKAEKRCIVPTARCDGRRDCFDGSDEKDCSLEQCAIHPHVMYACEKQNACFRVGEVCNPYSACPESTLKDKLYCAGRQTFPGHF